MSALKPVPINKYAASTYTDNTVAAQRCHKLLYDRKAGTTISQSQIAKLTVAAAMRTI
jgi:hypothetical protein